MMARRPIDETSEDDRLTEAQARIELLEIAVADAEARAETAAAELAAANEARESTEVQLAEAAAAREAAEGEATRLRSDFEHAQARLAEAAGKYRASKLSSAPEIPAELVPEAASLEEIDEGFAAAHRLVGELRERMAEERQATRVPVGSPPRRAPDLSALPAAEKIKLGLQELEEKR
jgi:hypothetical protein